ncbi:MAG: hypothetical protein CL799_03675 [Chromatiales bacterium]|nr:hypothetical protein [Chromatiales bacterium]
MKQFTTLAGLLVILAAPIAIANAAVSDEEFAEVKQMLEQALERIDQLEGKKSASVPQTRAEQVDANTARLDSLSWAERISIKGDFRYRYQNDDIDDSVTAESVADRPDSKDGSRNRSRIQARAEITARLPSDVEVGLGLASGGDDPVSTNQTLGGGGSTKDINLDLAYFSWTGLENTTIRGGKVKNTFHRVSKSPLQWDSDWRPEGIDIAWDNGDYFAQAMGVYLESDSDSDDLESDSDSDDEFGYILQAGARGEVGGVSLLGGIGYTEFDAEGHKCFGPDSDLDSFGYCKGNEVAVADVTDPDEGGTYLYDFEVYNIFFEAATEAFGMPLTFFGDFIKNDDADDNDSGHLYGVQLGKAKQQGTWQIRYYYKDIEANATLGLLANSDFAGGGTNGKGDVLSGAYALTDQSTIKVTYYNVEKNSDNLASPFVFGNPGTDYDHDTIQVDMNFKYK